MNSTEPNVNLYMVGAMAIFISFIILGNLLILISVFFFKHMRSNINILIATLAMTDFLIGLVSAPMMIYIYIKILPLSNTDQEFYNWMWVIPNLLSILEILFVMLITIERFVATVYPSKVTTIFTKPKIAIYISLIILVTALWCIPSGIGFIWNINLIANIPYNFVTIYVFYIVPLIVVIVLYSITFAKFPRNDQPSHVDKKQHHEDSKLLTSWIFVIIFLILGYVPNSIWWSMSYYYSSFWMNIFSLVSNILQVANSFVNFFIYAAILPQFQECFAIILGCRKRTIN